MSRACVDRLWQNAHHVRQSSTVEQGGGGAVGGTLVRSIACCLLATGLAVNAHVSFAPLSSSQQWPGPSGRAGRVQAHC